MGSYGLTWTLKNPSKILKLAILNTPLTVSSPIPGLFQQLRFHFCVVNQLLASHCKLTALSCCKKNINCSFFTYYGIQIVTESLLCLFCFLIFFRLSPDCNIAGEVSLLILFAFIICHLCRKVKTTGPQADNLDASLCLRGMYYVPPN